MNNILTLILFFKVVIVSSQSIKIFDDKTKTSIPYVNVTFFLENKIVGGDYSNEKGYVIIPNGIEYENIKLSCIGYKNKIIYKKNIVNDTILLTQDVVNLNEVIIPKRNDFILGYIHLKKEISSGIGKGIEVVVFIENNTNKPLFIKSFLFNLNKFRNKDKIRIHFYEIHSDKFEPGNEINKDDIIYNLDGVDEKKIEINISQYGLYLPSEGGFIGLESLGINDLYPEGLIGSKKNIDFDLNSKVKKSWTFIKNRFKDNKWGHINFGTSINKTSSLNASFAIKVYD